jgi:hypothetical protein
MAIFVFLLGGWNMQPIFRAGFGARLAHINARPAWAGSLAPQHADIKYVREVNLR